VREEGGASVASKPTLISKLKLRELREFMWSLMGGRWP
jgi:hypothetical protein